MTTEYYNGSDCTGSDAADVWNEAGSAVDLRFESDTDANLLFLDGSANNVGIGTTTPQNTLNVIGAINSTTGFIVGANTGLTGNYSNNYCWNAYTGGILYSTIVHYYKMETKTKKYLAIGGSTI
jgi:hypothetical protein